MDRSEDMLARTSVRASRNRWEVFFGVSTIGRILGGNGGLDFLFVDIEVRIYALHIVVIFERFDHPKHLLRLLAAQFDVVLRNPGYLGRRGRNTRAGKRIANFL